MCSIIGLSGRVDAAPLVVRGLRRMEYRGYDSAGVAALDGSEISVLKGVGKVAEVNKEKGLDSLRGSIAIGHTRWATHGGVSGKNAHPHISTFGRVAVVHNGIVDNYESLRDRLGGEGYTFKSETDTEVIANLLDKNYSPYGQVRETVARTVSQLKGKYAFAAIFENGAMAAARDHEPMILGIAKDGVFVSSDVLGFSDDTDRVIFLENKDFAVVERGEICVYGFDGLPVPCEVTTVAKEFGDASKGDFVHYTLKEIHEQPGSVLRAGSLGKDDVGKVAKLIAEAGRVYVTACGTSYHAAMMGAQVLTGMAGVEAEGMLSSEAPFRPVRHGPGTLMLALSQSGETADVLEVVEKAKSEGTTVAALVNVPTSSLAREADAVVALNCGVEVGVAATKSFSSQVAALYRIAEVVSGGKFHAGLEKLPDAMKEALASEEKVRSLARTMKEANDVYVLGAGLNYYAALESSLKLKELSYVHAEALPGGELKHGPLALVDSNTFVIVLNPRDGTYDYTVSSVSEVKARGAKIVGVSDVASNQFDFWIPVPSVPDVLYPIVEVVPMQLLAYYLALERKADPDYPRNLAKSVTVK